MISHGRKLIHDPRLSSAEILAQTPGAEMVDSLVQVVHESVQFTVHRVFPMICGLGGSKSRLAKAVGAEPFGQMRDEKLHTVVARSTFASEKVKGTSRSEHFWKLSCRKRHCGAKHISKSKV